MLEINSFSITELGSFCSKPRAPATYSFQKNTSFKGEKMQLVCRSLDAHIVYDGVRE